MNDVRLIAMVAGEASGDLLGAKLIRSLKVYYPNAYFEGIGGKLMQKEGFHSLFPMERLSVMGVSEVIKRLFELLKIRYVLKQRWLKKPPCLFVGIDAPDFNLSLERQLYHSGIKTVHYISPSIWAWREKRVKKIQGNMDLMLTLFPFEQAFYQKQSINSIYVGHPLADSIPLTYSQKQYRQLLNISNTVPVLAVLPGSRHGEVGYLAEPFFQACRQLLKKINHVVIIVPAATPSIKNYLITLRNRMQLANDIYIINGQSYEVMAAADVVLLASGTATLEAMLLRKPMIVAGKTSWLTYQLIRLFNLLKVKHVSLPNNLLNKPIVPELLQDDITANNLVTAVVKQFNLSDSELNTMQNLFQTMHHLLRKDASACASKAIYNLLHNQTGKS